MVVHIEEPNLDFLKVKFPLKETRPKIFQAKQGGHEILGVLSIVDLQ